MAFNYCKYVLFTKLPWLGDSEETFWFRVKLPLVHLSTTHYGVFTLSSFVAERQARKQRIPIFIVFGLARPEIEPKSNVSVTDARSLIGEYFFFLHPKKISLANSHHNTLNWPYVMFFCK